MLPPNETERKQIIQAVFGNDIENRGTKLAFDAYLKQYDTLVRPGSPTAVVINVGSPALKSHADVLRCVRALREKPQSTFDEFTANTSTLQGASSREKEHVANLAINVLFMMDCGSRNFYSEEFKVNNLSSAKWVGDTRFDDFMKHAFDSLIVDSSSQPQQIAEAVKHKKALKAWKLSRRCNIEIKATSNLLEHLSFDPGTRSLKVFHHVSFLRAQLEHTKDEPLTLGFEDSLKR